MAISEEEKEFASHVVDLLQSVGPCESKRMFGGFGLFLEGLMFGLIADNVLYFKVDDENRSRFDEEGLPPFTYDKNGKSMEMSYCQAPEEALEDLEIMRDWGVLGFEAALRNAAGKVKKKR